MADIPWTSSLADPARILAPCSMWNSGEGPGQPAGSSRIASEWSPERIDVAESATQSEWNPLLAWQFVQRHTPNRIVRTCSAILRGVPMPMYEALRTADPAVFQALELEVQRQRHHLELIASENYVSRPVMQAMGSHFTNKYAEGYPGRRYYGGCVNVDTVEELARDPRQAALRRRARQRAAPQRRPGQHGRLPGRPEARRHGPGPGPGPRRPPHPRPPPEQLRHPLQVRGLPGPARTPSAWTWTRSGTWPGSTGPR